MTVKELIAELCKFDFDMEVNTVDDDYNHYSVHGIEIRNLLDGEEYDNLEPGAKLTIVIV